MLHVRIVGTIGILCLAVMNLSAQATKGGVAEVKEKPGITGKTFALIVGISDYQSEMIRDLNWAESDARSFSNYLKSKSGGNIPAQNIIELYGKDANSTNLWEKGIGYYFFHKKMFKPGDRLLLYFSGHGGAFNNHDRDNAFFFVWDANHATDGDANLKISQIKDLIHTLVEEDVQVVFIFDACRSVDVGVKGGIDQVNKIVEEQQGEILLTASKGGTVAYESSRLGHGVFTYYLVRGLFGEADQAPKDGKIKGYELDSYLKSSVLSHSQEEFKAEQFPFMSWGTSNKLEGTTLFQYDPEEGKLAIAAMDLKTTQGIANSSLLAMKSATKSATSKAGDYLSLFDRAVKQGKIIRPTDSCAYFYFSELKKLNLKEDLMTPLRSTLSTELMEMARKVINEDLAGKRNYWSKGRNKTSFYDADYYGVPVEALLCYSKIVPVSGRNPSYSSLFAYCRARYTTFYPFENEAEQRRSWRSGLEVINAELARNPNKAYLYFAKGVILSDLKRYPESILSQKKASQLAPLWTYPILQMTVASFRSLGMTDSVNYYFNKLKGYAGDSQDKALFSNLGSYELERRQYDSARYYFRRALLLDSSYTDAWHQLGRIKHMQGAPDSAAYFYRVTLKIDPKYTWALDNLGLIKNDLGQRDSAEIYYHRSLKINGKNTWPLERMAELKKGQGQLDSAVYYFRKVARYAPEGIDPLNAIAEIKSEQKQIDSAVYYYNKVLKIDSVNERASYFVAGFIQTQNREKFGIGDFSFRMPTGGTTVFYRDAGSEVTLRFDNPEKKPVDISLIATGATFEKLGADRFVIFPTDYKTILVVTVNGIPMGQETFSVDPIPYPEFELIVGKTVYPSFYDNGIDFEVPKRASEIKVVPVSNADFKDQKPRDAEYRVIRMEVTPFGGEPIAINSDTIDLKKYNIKPRDRITIKVSVVRINWHGKAVEVSMATVSR